jgi:hypothetical protein
MTMPLDKQPQSGPVDRSHWVVRKGTLKELESDEPDLSETMPVEQLACPLT